MKTFLALSLALALGVVARADPGDWHQTQCELLLVNGSDFEAVFEFNYSGVTDPYRKFVVPRDASITVTFPVTTTAVRCVIKRGDTLATMYTGVYKTLWWDKVHFFGLTQQSNTAFTGYESSNPRLESTVWTNGIGQTWIANNDLGYPVEVAVTSGGGGGTSSTPAQESTDYFDTFTLGFWTGLGWELFGLMIAIVRRLRTSTGME